MTTFILLELFARRKLRRERVFRNRSHPMDCSEETFLEKYRFPRPLFFVLCGELRRDLQHKTQRSQALSVEQQVLWALKFLTCGSFQGDVSAEECHQSSVSRTIDRVVTALNEKAWKYVNFPLSVDCLAKVKSQFNTKCNFPDAVGVVDCTHIRIKHPSVPDSDVYLNKKKQYSINTQVVCDTDLRILDVVARWPGSIEDSGVWKASGLRKQLMSGVIPQPFYLLGDSEYPLEPCLLTPIASPKDIPQKNFNSHHYQARQCIERCFSVLMSRFHCVDQSRGTTLLYHPEKVCKIFMAVCVLHNFLLQHGYKQTPSEELNRTLDEVPTDSEEITVDSEFYDAGNLVRCELISSKFT